MRFEDLNLAKPILRAIAQEGYETATPIQAEAIPHILAGRDLLGCAQTGTGKTAAFALPILHRLNTNLNHQKSPPPSQPRCLVLCPTRELATQIADGFRTYGAQLPTRGAVIFGGVGQGPQVQQLRRGVDVLIATPGRLLDLMEQGHVNLRRVDTLVLDEADRMLDMGFIHDIRRITAETPAERQTLMFSATMPAAIRELSAALLRDPISVSIAAARPTVDRISQSVHFVERAAKPALLAQLIETLPMRRVIVFTRTRHGADRLVKQLHPRVRAEAIHGNKTQNARTRALNDFRCNRVGVLVATDIAARGIDVDGVTHVVNYDLTHEPETYVHRIGRTARAGAEGAAISFCSSDEIVNLRAIERMLRQSIPVNGDRPAFADAARTEVGRHPRGRTRVSPARPVTRRFDRKARRPEPLGSDGRVR